MLYFLSSRQIFSSTSLCVQSFEILPVCLSRPLELNMLTEEHYKLRRHVVGKLEFLTLFIVSLDNQMVTSEVSE